MTITNLDMYKDGGTITVTVDGQVIFIDGRIGSSTQGTIYDRHPNKEGARQIPWAEHHVRKLIACLRDVETNEWSQRVAHVAIRLINQHLNTLSSKSHG